MKLEWRHRLSLLLILCLAWFAWRTNHKPAPAPDPTGAVNARAPEANVPQDTAAYEQELSSGLQALTRMEDAKEKRDGAAAKSLSVRAQLQAACTNAWLEVLTTNEPAFLALRDRAKHSPNEETPCTLCDGKGYMHFCLVCRKNRGVCQACGGLGHNGYNELCPACLGTRKCYNCFGSGKMLCPFCNDGTISANGPRPPSMMPVR